ncbi:MAG: DUF2062 domain-containing protein [Planctomycetota bacterium]|nr:MAG: DUF2062 domain-containing protein [Planctomycetota bacterium]
MVHLRRRMIRSLLIINDTPERVARGVAIGTFITFQPLVGIQMALGAGLALITRSNIAATIPPAWITNPVTIIPIYLFLHWLGNLFVRGPALRWEQLKAALAAVNHIRSELGIWASMRFAANEFMTTIIWPMAIGGIIIGLLSGAIMYWLTLTAVRAYQQRKLLRRLEWVSRSKPEDSSNVEPVPPQASNQDEPPTH